MSNFKVGDAVVGESGAIFLVLSLDGPDDYPLHILDADRESKAYVSPEGMMLLCSYNTPYWIIKWREENMPPPAPTNTEESSVDALRKIAAENVQLSKDLVDLKASHKAGRTQIRTLKDNAAEMRAEIMNNCHAHEEILGKLAERDEENINLRIGARNDCDNIELLNAKNLDLRTEKDAYERRWRQAERDLKSATTTRDASIQTVGMQLEALSSVRKELAAEKAFNVSDNDAIAFEEERTARKKAQEEEVEQLKHDLERQAKTNSELATEVVELVKELDWLKTCNEGELALAGKRLVEAKQELTQAAHLAAVYANATGGLVANKYAPNAKVAKDQHEIAKLAYELAKGKAPKHALQLKLDNIRSMTREENSDD